MERILQITGGAMNRNDGIANFVMNIYRHIDKSKYQFDFLVIADKEGDYDREIKKLGGKIYYVEKLRKNIIKHMVQTYHAMNSKKYLAIHRHTTVSLSWPDFYIAKKAGINNRICHSHGTTCLKPVLHRLFYPLLYRNITHRLACGIEAGRWLYPEKESFLVQKNGIDTEKFQFNIKIREELRDRLGISQDTLVIGNVGRLAIQKNQTVLLDAFSEIVKRKINSVLILLGEGELEGKLKRKAQILGVENKVLFPGVTSSVSSWLCAMDVAVYPSLFEGFPIAVLESEASGIPTIISNEISDEIDILGNLIQISLSDDKYVWAEAILKVYERSNLNSREECYRQIMEAGYDIKNTVKELEEFYNKLR